MRFLRRRPLLPPLPDGFDDYWAVLHVALTEPLAFQDDQCPPAVGYYRCGGLRCRPAGLTCLLAAFVDGGLINWSNCGVNPVEPNSLGRDVREGVHLSEGENVWYATGRAYYPAIPPVQPAN